MREKQHKSSGAALNSTHQAGCITSVKVGTYFVKEQTRTQARPRDTVLIRLLLKTNWSHYLAYLYNQALTCQILMWGTNTSSFQSGGAHNCFPFLKIIIFQETSIYLINEHIKNEINR
jgi:hypothetical protein